MWYSFALREAPKYEAAAFNTDINETFWLGLAEDADPEHIARECPEHIARECYYQKLRRFPPVEDYCPAIWCHSLVDPSYAPAGMHVAQSEQLGPPATTYTEREWLEIKKRYAAGMHVAQSEQLGPPAPTYTEREWLEIKKRYAEELISIWKRHAPNMNWDNIVGVDSNSPYDCLRQTNCGPNGNMAILDCPPPTGLRLSWPTTELP